MSWWPMVKWRQGRQLHGHGQWRRPVFDDPRRWGRSGTTARATQQGGGSIWGQQGRGVLTDEPVHGGVGQRRGTVAVEVDHRSREPVRRVVRSTERWWSSWKLGRGQRMAEVAHPHGGARGQGGGFRNSPQRRCFIDASEPAHTSGRGGACGTAGPAFEARWHGTPAAAACRAEAHSVEARVRGK
jgi:hypothetical protein